MENISIIIPVYNEEILLRNSVDRLVSKLKKAHATDWEILLIENGSKDDSLSICYTLSEKYKGRIIVNHIGHSSYGEALHKGIHLATKENIFIFNVDFWDMNFFKKSIELKSDIVVGSKTLIGSNDRRPYYRRLITYFFNTFLRLVYNFQGTDTHGIKRLKSSSCKQIALTCYPLHELYDTQLVLHACKKKLMYSELPISIREVRPSRYNELKRFKNIIHDLVVIFKYRYL